MSDPRSLLITGAGGMVGRNLAEHPGLSGWTILSPSRRELDLADRASTEAYLAAHKPDVVIHTAGKVGGIQANIAHPVSFLIDNLDVGRNVIMAAYAAGVPTLLNVSSSCVYPRGYDEPLREEQIMTGALDPSNEGYALAKIATTQLCSYIRRENPAMQYKTLIPCNMYGRHDKFAPEQSHLIPAIITKVHDAKVNGVDEVEIWGDGTARRELMDAADLADALVRAVDHADTMPEVMNVGLGLDHTINEYYAAAAKVIGWEGRFVHDLGKPVGMSRKLVDTTRLHAWGWQARTSIEDGIRKAYSYYLNEWR